MDNPVLPLDRWPDRWRPIPYGRIKTGYVVDPSDPLHIIPDPEAIVWIEQAFDYLAAGSSLRETTDWLNQKLKLSMVHQTLATLYAQHRKPYTKAKTMKRTRKPPSRDTKKLISEKAKARAQLKKAEALEKKLAQKKLQVTSAPDYVPVEKDETPRVERYEQSPFYSAQSPENYKIHVAFKPNPGPQTQFLQATETQVLYGGAAGGGKSFAMLADPMRYFGNPNFVGLLIRRTNDELKELIRESHKMYKRAFPGAEFKKQESVWKFPSGAEFWMTYLDKDEDVYRYQGQSFCWIGVDELTQYPTPFAWNYLYSRLRTTDPELKKNLTMRATTNPGGPGHQWVKKMFVDPAIPGTPFWAVDMDTGDILLDPDTDEPLLKRRFIPANLKDNPYLADDGIYRRTLLALPEDQRRKLLDGDWSVVEGAAFPEFNPKIHVQKKFDIPHNWRCFRSGDFGYSSFSAVLWFAIDPTFETLIVYRELYVSKKTGRELAKLVLSIEAEENISYGILDSSVWHQRGHYGPSIAEEMIQEGCRWRPADRTQGSRVAGKNRLHELLRVNEHTGKPGLIIFENCRQLLADLPMIPSDPNGGDDIDDRYASDHTYDALRYGIMSRPRSQSPLDWGNKSSYQYQPADSVFGY